MRCVPYSPDIPWVQVCQAPGVPSQVACHACRVQADVQFQDEVEAFAAAHHVHTAGPDHVGLGDLIAGVAKPVASLFGKAPCTPCEARRRAANQLRFRRPW